MLGTLLAGLVLLGAGPAMAQAPLPENLACIAAFHADWSAEEPRFEPVGRKSETGGVIVHLAPGSGRWVLQVEGSAAMADDSGTFGVAREGLAHWFDEWVGIDRDKMLRISGGGHYPYRFLFMSSRYTTLSGTCSEPDEPFLFLRP